MGRVVQSPHAGPRWTGGEGLRFGGVAPAAWGGAVSDPCNKLSPRKQRGLELLLAAWMLEPELEEDWAEDLVVVDTVVALSHKVFL